MDRVSLSLEDEDFELDGGGILQEAFHGNLQKDSSTLEEVKRKSFAEDESKSNQTFRKKQHFNVESSSQESTKSELMFSFQNRFKNNRNISPASSPENSNLDPIGKNAALLSTPLISTPVAGTSFVKSVRNVQKTYGPAAKQTSGNQKDNGNDAYFLSTPSDESVLNNMRFSTPISPIKKFVHSNSQRIEERLNTPTSSMESFILGTGLPSAQGTNIQSNFLPVNSTPETTSDLQGRKRKFPGPAGLLSALLPGQDLSSLQSLNSSLDKSALEPENGHCRSKSVVNNEMCSQNSIQHFSQGPWLALKNEFGLQNEEGNSSSFLNCMNIQWVCRKAASSRTLCTQKVPFLAVVLKSLDWSSADGSGVFCDRTGEIQGAIHHEVLVTHSKLLSPGSALLLRNVAILTTGSGRRHLLIVTGNNLVSIYAAVEGKIEVMHFVRVTKEELISGMKEAMKSGKSEFIVANTSLTAGFRQPEVSQDKQRNLFPSASFQCPKPQKQWEVPKKPSLSVPRALVSTSANQVEEEKKRDEESSLVDSLLEGIDEESLFGDF